MPRQPRIVLPGYLHHVTQRGNYGQIIFREDKDRVTYLKYLNKYAQKYDLSIYAYCLMNNHVHLIVKPKLRSSLVSTIHAAHQRYAYYFHKCTNDKGHLWQSRYYSCVMLGTHIENAIRYVERNPVRAKIVKYPWYYSWSSARAHLGKEYQIIQLANINDIVTVGSWRDFLLKKETKKELEAVRSTTLKGKVFGMTEHIKKLENKLKLNLLPRSKGRPKVIKCT